ncbi:MAG: ribonuclease R [bacterium]|nr:ribonuclease R [bacterium]
MERKSEEKTNDKKFEVVIRTTRKGFGFVTPPGKEEGIKLERKELNTALNGDLVMADISRLPRITKIIKRKKMKFVGLLEKDADGYFVIPDDLKVYCDFFVPKESLNGAKEGEKVQVSLQKWTDPVLEPIASVERVLGAPGKHAVEMDAILIERELEEAFPDNVLKEAEKLSKNISEDEVARRRDMRGITTFTIDPETAKDFDDALSLKTLPNGNYEIGIHIADVSHFVRPGTVLDDEARKRSTSIYLVDRVIPMLPEKISNDLCSLNPNEDRLSYSAIFEIDKDAQVQAEWFGRTIIHSDKRFSYKEAQDTIDAKTGILSDELLVLDAISKKLKDENAKAGSINFEEQEFVCKIDENGTPVSFVKREPLDTHKLIEQFMLLANRRVAHFVEDKTKDNKDLPFIYRIHKRPEPEKLENLRELFRNFHINLPNEAHMLTNQEINSILEKTHGTPIESLVGKAFLKSMQRAEYNVENIGHFGLSFKSYTHFTSPIRRYADLMIHRLLSGYLSKDERLSYDKEWYKEQSLYASQRERVAEEAERESIKYKQAEYISMHAHTVWNGRVAGINNFGMFVEDLATGAQGLLHIRDLGDEYFTYNEKEMKLVGEKSKKAYQLGDPVSVRVKRVDVGKRQIDLLLKV